MSADSGTPRRRWARLHAFVLFTVLVGILPAVVATPAGGAESAAAANVPFSRSDFDVSPMPTSVGVGDFDGNGVPDMAMTSFTSASVSILLGDGSGTFVDAGRLPTGAGPLSVAVEDFDGDDAEDLAVANFNDNTVSLLFGHGDGTFTPSALLEVGSIPASVVAQDFDADGRADLAVVNLGSETVSVLLGDGAGGFSRHDVAVGRAPRMVVGADFDVDGNVDLAIANYSSNSVSVLTGDGAGNFSRQDVDVAAEPRSIASADFNGDGRPDLVTGDYGTNDPTGKVSVLRSTRGGGFSRADVVVSANPRAVSIGDFNADGAADIAVASHAGNSISMLLGDGQGGFVRADDVGVSSGPYHLATGDFTADDHPDLVVANQDANSLSILLGEDTSPPTNPTCVVRRRASTSAPRTVLGVADLRSGVASVDVVASTNATVRVTPFPAYGAFSEVEVVAETLDPVLPSRVEVAVADGAGQVSTCASTTGSATTTTTPATTTTSVLPTTTTTPSPTTTTTIAPGGPATPLVTSFAPSSLRRDFTGWVGSTISVGAADLQVTALGRWVVAGNTGSHAVKLVDAATGRDVASATVATAGAPAGAFRYTNLTTPVTLRANTVYYLASEETAGGDTWYDYDTRVVTTAGARDTGVVYAMGSSPTSWISGGASGNAYGPPNLLYSTGSPPSSTVTSVSPTTTTTPATTTTTPATTTTSVLATTTTPSPTTTTTIAPGGPATPLVTSFTPSSLRRDFTGWVGSTISVGAADLQVTALGRWVVAGNTGSHAVKLVEAATGRDVASATVATAGAPAGAFRYTNLTTPVTLRANTVYYLASEETAGGDTWYDYDTRVVTTAGARDTGVVYAMGSSPTSWISGGASGNAYGPPNLLYTGGSTPPSSVPPGTTTTAAPTTTTSTVAPTTTTTTPAPGGAGTPLVTSFTPTNLRWDFTGWVGSSITVGAADLQVSALGRWVLAGNTRSHTVKLVEAATGTDVASTVVSTAGAPAEAFRYAPLATPVVLRANTEYYLVSEEAAGTDAMYDWNTRVVTTPAAADTGVVWAFASSPGNFSRAVSPAAAFGPLSLLYS